MSVEVEGAAKLVTLLRASLERSKGAEEGLRISLGNRERMTAQIAGELRRAEKALEEARAKETAC